MISQLAQNFTENQNIQSQQQLLCKIEFSLPIQNTQCISEKINVYSNSNVYNLATQLGDKLGIGYDQGIQQIIIEQLWSYIKNSPKNQTQQNWQQLMLGVVKTCKLNMHDNNACQKKETFQNYCQQLKDTNVEQGLNLNYFKSEKTLLGKHLQILFKQDYNASNFVQKKNNTGKQKKSLYDRSIEQITQKNQKIMKIREEQQNKKIKECTFIPCINSNWKVHQKKSRPFFKKPQIYLKNQNSLTLQKCQNQNHNKDQSRKVETKQTTFNRLYKDAFDIQSRKNNRYKKYKKQQESGFEQYSFIPVINQCSKQICRAKSHNLLNSQKNINNMRKIGENTINQQNIGQKFGTKKMKQRSESSFSFKPQISAKSRQLTQNFPSFREKLDRQLKIIQKNNTINKSKSKQARNLSVKTIKSKRLQLNPHQIQKEYPKPHYHNQSTVMKLKIRKQTYIIEDQECQNAAPSKQELKDITPNYNYVVSKTAEKKILAISPSILNKKFLDKNSQSQKENDMLWTPKHKKYKDQNLCQNFNVTKPKQSQKNYQKLQEQRRTQIFQSIFCFMTQQPPLSPKSFASQNFKNENKDFTISSLLTNPYIPPEIYDIFEPLINQLDAASVQWQQQVSFNKDQFTWALQKLYDSLQINKKGSFIAWGVKLLPLN